MKVTMLLEAKSLGDEAECFVHFVWSLWRNFHQMGCQETPISAGFGNPPGAEMFYLAWWHGEVALVPCSNFFEVPVSHCSNPGFGRRFVLLTHLDGLLPWWNLEVVHNLKHSFKCAGRSLRSRIFMFASSCFWFMVTDSFWHQCLLIAQFVWKGPFTRILWIMNLSILIFDSSLYPQPSITNH